MKKLLFVFSVVTALFFTACDPNAFDDLFNDSERGDSISKPGSGNDSIPGLPGIGGDSIPNIPGIGGDSIVTPNPTPDEIYKNKEDFQKVALELRNEFKASDFENIMDLAEYISNEYAEYDTEYAKSWFEGCLESLGKKIGSGNNYDIYESIYKLSAFKGKWVANDKTQCWEKSNANNLSLHVKDQNGNPCEITLTTSGNTKKVHCFDSQDEYYNGGYYDYENDVWVEDITYGDIYKIYVEVPEKVTIVVKQNGAKLAEAIINTDLSSMSGVDYNLATDKYSANATLYFNGYTASVENLHYQNKKESGFSFSFKHGNKTIVSAKASATPELYKSNFDEEWEEEDINLKNNFVTVNILGKLELKGSCNNLLDLVEVIDDEWDETTDSKINRHLKINVHFYGESEPTAKIEFECEEDGYYDSYWGEYVYDYDLIPVIEFQDYSRHSLEDFFNEEDFQKTVDAFESLLREFENLVEGYDFDF